MDEKLRESMAEMLSFLQESMVAGKELAGEQIPLLLQEILNWGIAERLLIMGTWIIGGIFIIYLGRVVFSNVADLESYDACNGDSEEVSWVVGRYVLPWIGVGTIFVTVTLNIFQVVEILVAPRLYLLEVVTKLLN